MKVQLFLILSVWSCAEWSRVDGHSPRFLPGLNQNRFNLNPQMLNQRPQRPPSTMNWPPQPDRQDREPQSSHPTSGKEFHLSAILGHHYDLAGISKCVQLKVA